MYLYPYHTIPWPSHLDNVDVGQAEEHGGPHRGHQGEAVGPAHTVLKLLQVRDVLTWGLSCPP